MKKVIKTRFNPVSPFFLDGRQTQGDISSLAKELGMGSLCLFSRGVWQLPSAIPIIYFLSFPPPPNGQVDNSFQNSRVNANSSFGSTENSTENILRYTKVLTLEATGQIFNWREEMNEFQRKH